MSSKDWSPIRRLAEMLHDGHRNISTFLWTSELGGGKAQAAIAEMVRDGLLIERGFAIEPTAAFPDWLADFRLRENQSKAAYLPDPTVDESVPEAAAAEAPATKQARVRKPYFPHLSRDRREAGRQMAARIRDLIEQNTRGRVRLADVKRSLHGNRHREAWEEGLRLLKLHRIATIEDGVISPTWSGSDVLPDPYRLPEKATRRKQRVQSEWFLRNRRLMDEGQHSGFDNEDSEDEDEVVGATDDGC
jgi:hypothetical protein